jgi:hypothetical protein
MGSGAKVDSITPRRSAWRARFVLVAQDQAHEDRGAAVGDRLPLR